MGFKRAYGPAEISRLEGISIAAVWYYVNTYNVDCYRTGNNRLMFTEEQFKKFRALRSARLQQHRKGKRGGGTDNAIEQ